MIAINKVGIDKKGYFKAELNGKDAGLISFSLDSNNIFIIEHTKVKKEFQHQGIAWELLSHLLMYAREKHYKIIPECEYAKSVFKLKPEIQDVLHSSYQA